MIAVVPTDRLEDLVDDYERSMVREARSPATIKTYLWALDDLTRFLAGRDILHASQLARPALEAWQDQLQPRMRARSRGLAATAARQFLRWAADRDLVDLKLTLAIARVRARRLLPRPIPPEDLSRVKAFLAPRRPQMAVEALRDRALFFYLLATGARISEALQVTRNEVTHALVWQKGGSQKVLMAPPRVVEVVDDYLKVRRDDCPWLWVTYDNNRPLRRLTADGAREIWKRVARKVGVPRWTTHQLRHTCATELLDAGVPELVVAEHLGHHGLSSIPNYAQVRPSQRQRAVDVMQTFLTDQEPPRPAALKPLRRHRRRAVVVTPRVLPASLGSEQHGDDAIKAL